MLLNSAKTIFINTGNIINSKELKKKAMQSPTEEVFDCVSGTFHTWLKSNHETSINNEDIFCQSSKSVKIDSNDRSNLKISAKVFLESFDCDNLKSSILEVMDALDVSTIDSLVVAFPVLPLGEKVTLDCIKPLWQVLENFVQIGKIVTIGVSDLDKPELAELYEWTQVKPSVNQVNLESCCVMPPEMIAFAKDNDIQLLTHNDPKVILPTELLHQVLTPGVSLPDEWKTSWIVRYSIVVKTRGIIQTKGYLFRAIKNM